MITADNNILTKVNGTGIGYPMRTNDGMINPEKHRPNPRADSYSLYLNFVANQVLNNILPKNKLR